MTNTVEESAASELDLDAYFTRIGYTGPRESTLAALEQLQVAHGVSIPFENLDIQLGLPISIDLASIQTKLVRARRGGYCFEQNTLLAAALEKLGFRVTRLSARVRLGANRVLPRTHMLLAVDTEGKRWLVDVGFGTGGPLKPLLLSPGVVFEQSLWSFRLREDNGQWVLESLRDGAWHDLYVFTLEPHYPIDFEMANHYVSTHPASRFVQTLAVQKQSPDVCSLLRNRELTIIRGQEKRVTEITDDEALLRVLAETFGLVFPRGTRFKCLAER
jgi:N-hydroxyarylamine O-acetyltransferase